MKYYMLSMLGAGVTGCLLVLLKISIVGSGIGWQSYFIYGCSGITGIFWGFWGAEKES